MFGGGLGGLMGLLGAGLMATDKKTSGSLLPLLMLSGLKGGNAMQASAGGGADPAPAYLMNNVAGQNAAVPGMRAPEPRPTMGPGGLPPDMNNYPGMKTFDPASTASPGGLSPGMNFQNSARPNLMSGQNAMGPGMGNNYTSMRMLDPSSSMRPGGPPPGMNMNNMNMNNQNVERPSIVGDRVPFTSRPVPEFQPELQPPSQYPPSLNFMDPQRPQQHPNMALNREYPSHVEDVASAIKDFESGGKYTAIGPRTRSGDRAYGGYQVMGNNIGPWSKEALGYKVSKEQFLNSPRLQDAVAHYKMNQYYDKYGSPEDTASMWFSGRPSRNNNSRDILGTSVPQYITNVRKRLKSRREPSPFLSI